MDADCEPREGEMREREGERIRSAGRQWEQRGRVAVPSGRRWAAQQRHLLSVRRSAAEVESARSVLIKLHLIIKSLEKSFLRYV